MKITNVSRRVYNYHVDNKRDILIALFTNYIYAVCMVSVPVAIFIGEVYLVGLALLCAYSMFTVVVNRPTYKTFYGKSLMVAACTCGGLTSYLIGEFIKILV